MIGTVRENFMFVRIDARDVEHSVYAAGKILLIPSSLVCAAIPCSDNSL